MRREQYLQLGAHGNSAVVDEVQHRHRRGTQAEQDAEVVHQQHGALPGVAAGGSQGRPDKVKQGFEVGSALTGREDRGLKEFGPHAGCASPSSPTDPTQGTPACTLPAVPTAVRATRSYTSLQSLLLYSPVCGETLLPCTRGHRIIK